MAGTQTKFPLTQDKSEPETTCSEGPEKNKELSELFNRLWTAADELRANSKLRSTQYSTPVLGILFVRYADYVFEEAKQKLEKKYAGQNHAIRKLDYQAEGVVYLPENARYKYLLELPERTSIGKALDDAMRSLETENDELRDVLPKVYAGMEDRGLINLLKIFHLIPTQLDRDIFGKIYEYFLGKFAMSEGQRGGEFYTPTSVVRLIVEVVEPYHGRILDPACGSGGMFVQSAEFVRDHLKSPYKEIMVYGQEKAEDTVRLCKMNMAIHGLSGDVRQGNTYYEDLFNMLGQFDFVMANPPFNVNNVDREAIKDDPRYRLGLPTVDNANYLWIQVFSSMLNESGRAGFVMSNQAGDASYSELEIRRKLIEKAVVDVVISIGPNFFYTVTLPVTLWFIDKAKKDTSRKDKVLLIDAREIYNQVDRAHREFLPRQIEFISNIVRLYRGQELETRNCSLSVIKDNFPDLKYRDVRGLCKVATTKEIQEQGWSLNPNRYVGVIENRSAAKDLYNRMIDSVSFEINSTRTKILDMIAQTLYDRWFVNFQYPGNETAEIIQTPQGRIPKGWAYSSLKNLFPRKQVVMTGPFGSNLHAHDYRESGVPLILVKHVKNGRIIERGLPLVGEHKFPELNKYLLQTGDIVVTRVGFVGDSAYIRQRYQNWLFSGQMLRVRIPDYNVIHPLFLIFQYQTPEFRKTIENTAVGATRPSLNTKIIEEMKILLPPVEVQRAFVSRLSELEKLLHETINENVILKEIGDSLNDARTTLEEKKG